MGKIVRVLLGMVLVLGGMLATVSAASAVPAKPGSCSTGDWVLRSGPVKNISTGTQIGIVETHTNLCNQYWAEVRLSNKLGHGQWANAFVDVYVDGSFGGRLTCGDVGGNLPVSEGQSMCFTPYFETVDYGITYQSHAYVYNYPSVLFASGAVSQRCSRLMCDN
jgi:hypothetical protein